jgi:alpha-galactosidase
MVWRRKPGGADRTFIVPHLLGTPVRAAVLYPNTAGAGAGWDPAEGRLTVSLPRAGTAVLVRLGGR